MKKQHIEIYIEELNIVGFARGDRYRISESVQKELERLFAAARAQTLPSANITADVMDAGSFTSGFDPRPATLGEQIAGSVYNALTQSGGGSK